MVKRGLPIGCPSSSSRDSHLQTEEIACEQMLTPHQVIAVLRAALLFWQEEIAIHEPGIGYSYWQDQPYDPLSPDEVDELRRQLSFAKYLQVDPETARLVTTELLSAADLAASTIPLQAIAIVILPLNCANQQ